MRWIWNLNNFTSIYASTFIFSGQMNFHFNFACLLFQKMGQIRTYKCSPTFLLYLSFQTVLQSWTSKVSLQVLFQFGLLKISLKFLLQLIFWTVSRIWTMYTVTCLRPPLPLQFILQLSRASLFLTIFTMELFYSNLELLQ